MTADKALLFVFPLDDDDDEWCESCKSACWSVQRLLHVHMASLPLPLVYGGALQQRFNSQTNVCSCVVKHLFMFPAFA